jgi:hypothetical protein
MINVPSINIKTTQMAVIYVLLVPYNALNAQLVRVVLNAKQISSSMIYFNVESKTLTISKFPHLFYAIQGLIIVLDAIKGRYQINQ